jgi:phosphoglycolate phosphatase
MGLPVANSEDIRGTIGISLKETFRRLAGDYSQERSDEFIRWFVRRADQVMVKKSVLFESVPPTIEALKKRGLKLGIVSTKFRHRIEKTLRREKLEKYFDVIVGGEDVAEHKPDPKGLLTAIQLMTIAPAEVLYVGDSITDAETAMRAKVAFAAVLSGITPKEAFKEYNVQAFFDNLYQLPGLV